jgi:hypothetical protein
MRVLLTGAAGFIGTRVGAALADAGHDVVAVDAMLATAHGANAELPPDVQKVDVRDAAALAPLLEDVDVVCHQAAVVGAGVDAADAPSYGINNDFGTAVLLAEMFAAGCRRLVLASSMVVYGQGRYECDLHGLVDPLPRTRADLDAGVFEHRCPLCGEQVHWRLVDEDAPLRPRRRARPRRSTTRWRGPRRRAGRWSRCAITTFTGQACRGTHRIRAWRRSSVLSSNRETCHGFSKTAVRCATSSTSTTSPPPTRWR